LHYLRLIQAVSQNQEVVGFAEISGAVHQMSVPASQSPALGAKISNDGKSNLPTRLAQPIGVCGKHMATPHCLR